MNKQELIKKYEHMNHDSFRRVDVSQVLSDLIRLDEPQKATIPQFVADYIEFKKEQNFHVYGAMRVIEDHYDKRVPDWFYKGNVGTFARAWLDGYEVEEEKRYFVKLKAFDDKHSTLKFGELEKRWYFGDSKDYDYVKKYHTRKELEEAGFGEVFNSPLFEVEEVE